MRRPDVNDEVIIEAGNRLLANGQTVTGSALRKEVGDRGNVKRLADVWNAHQAETSRNNTKLQLPDQLLQHVDSAMASLKSQVISMVGRSHEFAVSEANKKADEAAAQALLAYTALEEQFSGAASLVDELGGQLEDARLQLEASRSAQQALLARDTDNRVLIAQLQERVVQLEARVGEDALLRTHFAECAEAKATLEGRIAELQAINDRLVGTGLSSDSKAKHRESSPGR